PAASWGDRAVGEPVGRGRAPGWRGGGWPLTGWWKWHRGVAGGPPRGSGGEGCRLTGWWKWHRGVAEGPPQGSGAVWIEAAGVDPAGLSRRPTVSGPRACSAGVWTRAGAGTPSSAAR